MTPFLLLLVFLAVLDVSALRWGTDSRDRR
jgi:hypothetical protein